MATLADATLTPEEAELLEGFARALEARLGEHLHGVWLFGSRARGEEELSEDSDVDVLVIADDATWEARDAIYDTLHAVARERGVEEAAWVFSVHVRTPAWLEGRREIRSFFIAEVDRDKIVVAGRP